MSTASGNTLSVYTATTNGGPSLLPLPLEQKRKVIGPLSEIHLFVPPEATLASSPSQQPQQQQPSPIKDDEIAILHSLQLYNTTDQRSLGLADLSRLLPVIFEGHKYDSNSNSNNAPSSISSSTRENNSSSPSISTTPLVPFAFPRFRSTTTPTTTANESQSTPMVQFRAKLAITTPKVPLPSEDDVIFHPALTPYGSALVRAAGVSQGISLYTVGEQTDVLVQGYAVGYTLHWPKQGDPYILLYASHPTASIDQRAPYDQHRKYRIETLEEQTFLLSTEILCTQGLWSMMQSLAADEEHQSPNRQSVVEKGRPRTVEWYVQRYQASLASLSQSDSHSDTTPESNGDGNPDIQPSPAVLKTLRSTLYQLFVPFLTSYSTREAVIEQGLLDVEDLHAFERRVAKWEKAKWIEWISDRTHHNGTSGHQQGNSGGEAGGDGRFRVVWKGEAEGEERDWEMDETGMGADEGIDRGVDMDTDMDTGLGMGAEEAPSTPIPPVPQTQPFWLLPLEDTTTTPRPKGLKIDGIYPSLSPLRNPSAQTTTATITPKSIKRSKLGENGGTSKKKSSGTNDSAANRTPRPTPSSSQISQPSLLKKTTATPKSTPKKSRTGSNTASSSRPRILTARKTTATVMPRKRSPPFEGKSTRDGNNPEANKDGVYVGGRRMVKMMTPSSQPLPLEKTTVTPTPASTKTNRASLSSKPKNHTARKTTATKAPVKRIPPVEDEDTSKSNGSESSEDVLDIIMRRALTMPVPKPNSTTPSRAGASKNTDIDFNPFVVTPKMRTASNETILFSGAGMSKSADTPAMSSKQKKEQTRRSGAEEGIADNARTPRRSQANEQAAVNSQGHHVAQSSSASISVSAVPSPRGGVVIKKEKGTVGSQSLNAANSDVRSVMGAPSVGAAVASRADSVSRAGDMDIGEDASDTNMQEEEVDELQDDDEVDELRQDEDAGPVETNKPATQVDVGGKGEDMGVDEVVDMTEMIRRLPWYFFDVPELLEDVELDRERDERERQQRREIDLQSGLPSEHQHQPQQSSQAYEGQPFSNQQWPQESSSQSQRVPDRKYQPIWWCPEEECPFGYPREIEPILLHSGKNSYIGQEGEADAEARRMDALWELRTAISQHIWTHLKNFAEKRIEGEEDVLNPSKPFWARYLKKLSEM
ncbi:hypothetical protein FRC17_002550 [Serendipita sp. 399]|nr:hypothetical protein FRC17_002550 [Serendipita sp. 399]